MLYSLKYHFILQNFTTCVFSKKRRIITFWPHFFSQNSTDNTGVHCPNGLMATWMVKMENMFKSFAAVYVLAFIIIYLLAMLIITTQNQSKRFSMKNTENVVSEAQLEKILKKLFSQSEKPSWLVDNKLHRSMRLPIRTQLNDHQAFELIEQKFNLAALYWEQWLNNKQKWKDFKRYDNVIYCDKVDLKPPEDLKYNNLYWQMMEVPTANDSFLLYLYNAYYDKRIPNKPMVKLITTTDRQILVEKVVFRFEVNA